MGTRSRFAKGCRGAAGALALLVLISWQGAILSQPSPPREAKVQLSWQPGWTATGISVEPGDTLSIRVRTIRGAAAEPQQECERNAAGAVICRQQERKSGTLAGTVLDFAARQVIVGRLGEGPPFVVGRRFKKVMQARGALSLRWNVPREAARAGQGFDVTITVAPGPPGDDGDEGNFIQTNGTGGSGGGGIDTHVNFATNNSVDIADNGSGAGAENEQADVVEAQENGVAAVAPVRDEPAGQEEPTGDGDANVSADDPPTQLSLGQKILLGAALAGLLLVLAAAGVALQRWRARRLTERTRAMLGVSPSLDLGEGVCRGGERPAGGPAASLRARLETGAEQRAGGAENG